MVQNDMPEVEIRPKALHQTVSKSYLKYSLDIEPLMELFIASNYFLLTTEP